MLKTLLTGTALVLTLTACSTVSPTREMARTASLAPTPARACVPETATRIPLKTDDCAAFGQSYTRGDLDQTGQHELGPALRMLDPSLTVHGR